MYGRILVPLEHSPADETILAHVRELARRLGSSLVLIHVAHDARSTASGVGAGAGSDEARTYLEDLAARLRAEGLDTRVVMGSGDLAKEICQAAECEDCDLIAMATHGEGLLESVVHRDVAAALRHLTKLPILTVPADRT